MKTTDVTFRKERSNTDQSLGAERESTNNSLAQAKGQVEQVTDSNLKEDRSAADKKTSEARDEVDSKRDHREPAKKSITDERSRSDAATKTERSRIDIAITREREVKTVIETKLLDQERKSTDKNLAVERSSTDTVVTTGSTRLISEIAEHSKTRSTLTTRDEFLAIVSHDLRNPIGAIFSCMEMLLEEIEERNIDPQTQKWLELAKRNADTSLRLISDIMDMERVSEGKLTVTKIKCDIGSIVHQSVDSFVHTASAKNILLRSVPIGLRRQVNCDHDRMVQVLSNLISNALKFTPEQGKVVVETTWDEKFLNISVCDTGPGIPDKMKEKIFEKFTQLKSKDRTGLGLGLHISKMLVESHGGTLTLESTVGKGSTFSVKLPL